MIIIGLLSVSLKHVQMSTLECYSTFNALSSGLNLINLGSKRYKTCCLILAGVSLSFELGIRNWKRRWLYQVNLLVAT